MIKGNYFVVGVLRVGSWSPKAKKLARQVFKRVSVKAKPEPRTVTGDFKGLSPFILEK